MAAQKRTKKIVAKIKENIEKGRNKSICPVSYGSGNAAACPHQQGRADGLQPVLSGHHGIFNSGYVGAAAACQDEASSITYSAIWPRDVIAGANVMVNFIRLPCYSSGMLFALLPLPVITPPPPRPPIRCEQMSVNHIT